MLRTCWWLPETIYNSCLCYTSFSPLWNINIFFFHFLFFFYPLFFFLFVAWCCCCWRDITLIYGLSVARVRDAKVQPCMVTMPPLAQFHPLCVPTLSTRHDLTTQRTPPLFQIYLLPAACHVKSLKKLREEFFRQDDDGALVIKVAEKREKRRLVTHDAIFRPYFFDVGFLR